MPLIGFEYEIEQSYFAYGKNSHFVSRIYFPANLIDPK